MPLSEALAQLTEQHAAQNSGGGGGAGHDDGDAGADPIDDPNAKKQSALVTHSMLGTSKPAEEPGSEQTPAAT